MMFDTATDCDTLLVVKLTFDDVASLLHLM
jgi:hypothetical protein